MTAPTATLVLDYRGITADGPDADTLADVFLLEGAKGVIRPTAGRMMVDGTLRERYDIPVDVKDGVLRRLDHKNGAPITGPVRVPANAANVQPVISYAVTFEVPVVVQGGKNQTREWTIYIEPQADTTVNLADKAVSTVLPGGGERVYTDLVAAAADLTASMDSVRTELDSKVTAATTQADRSTTEANRAQGIADTVQAISGLTGEDSAVALLIATPSSAVRSSLSANYHHPAPSAFSGLVTLLTGDVDETYTVTNCVASTDTQVARVGGRSRKFTMNAGTTTAILRSTISTGKVKLTGMTGVGLSMYFPEPEKVTQIGIQLFSSDGNRFNWASHETLRGTFAPKQGWNSWRFGHNYRSATTGSPVWGEIESIEIYVLTTSATTFNLGHVWAETRPKASLVFIHDGGAKLFDQAPGYFDLRDRGIPVVWSVDCAMIGGPAHVTRDRLIELGNENGNSISFHGWDGAISANYTSGDQARAETAKAQKWLSALRTKGNTGRLWRTAWMQNMSPYSPATNDMVLANPMWGNESFSGAVPWPFTDHDRYYYRREPIHNRTAAQLQSYFTNMQLTHGVFVCYTHNVRDNNSSDISVAMWAEFLRLVDEGRAAGWLECVTFEDLLLRDGATLERSPTGGIVVRDIDPQGNPRARQFI